MNYKITHFKKFNDERGELIVFLKHSDLRQRRKKFGQIYFVTFKNQDTIRGNHYHKKWREWFGIVEGKVKVILENVLTKKRKVLIMDSSQNKYLRLEIGPYIAHAFISLSSFAAILNYADSEWSEKDTYHYKLI